MMKKKKIALIVFISLISIVLFKNSIKAKEDLPTYKQGWFVGNGVVDCRTEVDIWCRI